jgi:diguanylate cyclase (GGDEF)-like protein
VNPKSQTRSLVRLVAGCTALFVVLAATGLALVRLEASQRSASADRLIVAEAAEIRAALGERLTQNVNLARGLRAFVMANPNLGDPNRFDILLREFYVQGEDIRNIGVAPDNRISHVYPVEGNEGALGLRYVDLPEQYATVQLAMETRESVLAGPIDLVQGGRGLIDRTPVYLPDGRYWGVVSLVLDVDSMIESVGADVDGFGLDWAVRTVASDTSPELYVGGDATVFDDPTAVLTMAVPNGSWELAVRPTVAAGGNALLIAFQVFAVLLAALVSVLVFERNRDRWRTRMLSLQDELTGLANRRHLEARAERACVAARRDEHPVSIAYLDLDDFKPINDRHGHRAGDVLLRAIAARLSSMVRDSDTVARVGGDEFVILLPDTRGVDARRRVEEFAKAIERPVGFEGHELRVRASFGVATYPDHGDSFETLLAHADSEMYDAKLEAGGGLASSATPAVPAGGARPWDGTVERRSLVAAGGPRDDE